MRIIFLPYKRSTWFSCKDKLENMHRGAGLRRLMGKQISLSNVSVNRLD